MPTEEDMESILEEEDDLDDEEDVHSHLDDLEISEGDFFGEDDVV